MDDSPDMKVRMPAALRARIAETAKEAGRSLNAEIRMRLEWSFEAGFDGTPTDKMLATEIESLRIELRTGLFELKKKMKGFDAYIEALIEENALSNAGSLAVKNKSV